jgi:hypothetical protein
MPLEVKKDQIKWKLKKLMDFNGFKGLKGLKEQTKTQNHKEPLIESSQ